MVNKRPTPRPVFTCSTMRLDELFSVHIYPSLKYFFVHKDCKLDPVLYVTIESLKSLLVNFEKSQDEILTLKFKETFKET